MQKRQKLILLKIFVPLLSVIVTLGLFEIFLRIIDYNPLKNITEKGGREHVFLRQSANKYVRYELNPGYQGTIIRAKIRINSAGFRGKEYKEKTGERYRICVLGDSVSLGILLNEPDLYTSKLERYFIIRDSTRVEVLNLAVEGYDTLQEVKHFEQKGIKFSPHLVIVAYCLNDIGITPLEYHKIKEFVSMKKSLRIIQFIKLKLNRVSLINELKREMDSIQGRDFLFPELYQPIRNDPVLEGYSRKIKVNLEKYNNPAWLKQYTSLRRIAKIRYSFQELKRMSKDKNFKVIVMIFPFFNKVGGKYIYRTAHDIIHHEAERLGFKVLDLTSSFDRYGFKKLTYDNVHLNAVGHKLTAQVLYEKIKPLVLKSMK